MTQATKPNIIVLSSDSDDEFRWLSDGWNDAKKSGTKKARALMDKARACIEAATDVTDAIGRLHGAGFTTTRSN